MTETWKPVIGYEGLYEVSDLGRVRSVDRTVPNGGRGEKRLSGKVLRLKKDRNGYMSVMLSRNGKQTRYRVHRLVAKAFVPNANGYDEVNHKDETRANNMAANLEWCTRQYNNTYGTLQERAHRLTSKPVKQIKDGRVIATYPSAMEAARKTNGTQGGISGCCRGELKSSGGYQWELA